MSCASIKRNLRFVLDISGRAAHESGLVVAPGE
jgi:hypothetical protein